MTKLEIMEENLCIATEAIDWAQSVKIYTERELQMEYFYSGWNYGYDEGLKLPGQSREEILREAVEALMTEYKLCPQFNADLAIASDWLEKHFQLAGKKDT